MMELCYLAYTIIMRNILVIRQGRILLEESVEQQKRLSLKICVGSNIQKFNNLTWSNLLRRWQTTQEIKINYTSGQPLELQLYYPSKSIPKVLGQAKIDKTVFSQHLEEELKIALTYDGMIKGWLYCQIGIEGEGPLKIQSKYLYIHKITFHFLEDYQNEFNLEICQNTQPIYQKKFILTQPSKTIFPNIKNSIRYSDVVRISLLNKEQEFKCISFLVDSVKRGKTAHYETWLRNKFNNKAGDVKVQYFLQNLFLQNDRKVMSRKAIFPQALSRCSSRIQNTTFDQLLESHNKNMQMAIQKIEEEKDNQSTNLSEKDLNRTQGNNFTIKKRTFKLKTGYRKQEIERKPNENAMPCLKRKHNPSMNKLGKKQDFYFQNPFE